MESVCSKRKTNGGFLEDAIDEVGLLEEAAEAGPEQPQQEVTRSFACHAEPAWSRRAAVLLALAADIAKSSSKEPKKPRTA
eukprot:4764512-Amphidinium_carterae.1